MRTPELFDQLIHQELDPWMSLSDAQVSRLRAHYEMLVRWNAKMNLTTVTPGREMIIRHYCESLFFTQHMPTDPDAVISVIDVGSGGGFPGVPIAVLRPAWRVTLVESNQRKCVFLRESTRHLKNVKVLARRIEDVTQRVDWLVSRAVNPEQVLANIPRLAPNIGLMLSETDFSTIQHICDVAWAEPVRLPWGDRRLCVYGLFHVEPKA